MADRNRRFTVAAFVLPLLFLAMSGLARANNIFVNTTDGRAISPRCAFRFARCNYGA